MLLKAKSTPCERRKAGVYLFMKSCVRESAAPSECRSHLQWTAPAWLSRNATSLPPARSIVGLLPYNRPQKYRIKLVTLARSTQINRNYARHSTRGLSLRTANKNFNYRRSLSTQDISNPKKHQTSEWLVTSGCSRHWRRAPISHAHERLLSAMRRH